MTINQRDIVEIAFYTGNKPEPHPAVVISNNEIFEAEGFFYAVLLSTKNHFPDFTMEITPDMITLRVTTEMDMLFAIWYNSFIRTM